jgi:(2R)-sulfolactate sulfo-lyase subunit alpha
MKYGILIHEKDDDVGVAVMNLAANTEIGAASLEGVHIGTFTLIENVPLGHKVALRALSQGKHVIEYGRTIGQAVQAIQAGAHVHTHNIKTLRW